MTAPSPTDDEAVEEDYFEVMPVADLPPANPFRTTCMGDAWSGAARPWWRPWKPCCWYHDQDWAQVSEIAVQLLGEAVADGRQLATDVYDFVTRRTRALRLGRRQEALFSLFAPAVAIAIGPAGIAYTNGQHRGQAMRDQGVMRTVVLRWPPLGRDDVSRRS